MNVQLGNTQTTHKSGSPTYSLQQPARGLEQSMPGDNNDPLTIVPSGQGLISNFQFPSLLSLPPT